MVQSFLALEAFGQQQSSSQFCQQHGQQQAVVSRSNSFVVSLSLKQGVSSVPKIEGLAVPKTVTNQSLSLNSSV